MTPSPDTTARPLVCAECGAESPPGAARWRGYLDDDGAAVVFCPECAEREFGVGGADRIAAYLDNALMVASTTASTVLDALGITLGKDILPLSAFNAYFPPLWLSWDTALTAA